MGRVCHGPSLLWAEMSSWLSNDLLNMCSEPFVMALDVRAA